MLKGRSHIEKNYENCLKSFKKLMTKHKPSQTLPTDHFRPLAILHSCFHRSLCCPRQFHHLVDFLRLGPQTCPIYFIGRGASPESDADGELTSSSLYTAVHGQPSGL